MTVNIGRATREAPDSENYNERTLRGRGNNVDIVCSSIVRRTF